MELTQQTLDPYLKLMRVDRPVGTLLLLWPTLAALWIAADGWPPFGLILVFTAGTFLMRAAGCVINDYADRKVDGLVKRTRERPLATGMVSEAEALILFGALAFCAFLLLYFLSPLTRWLALAGLAIAILYPFTKRWTYLPQVFLGLAFSWGLIMAFAELTNSVPSIAWLLFVASVLWIVAYDTLYAMVDRDDDIAAGIRSTAILFGSADRLMVGILQTSTLLVLALLGQQLDYSLVYYLCLGVCAGLFAFQQQQIRHRERASCFTAFKNNLWVGFTLFCGVVAEESVLPLLNTLKSGAS